MAPTSTAMRGALSATRPPRMAAFCGPMNGMLSRAPQLSSRAMISPSSSSLSRDILSPSWFTYTSRMPALIWACLSRLRCATRAAPPRALSADASAANPAAPAALMARLVISWVEPGASLRASGSCSSLPTPSSAATRQLAAAPHSSTRRTERGSMYSRKLEGSRSSSSICLLAERSGSSGPACTMPRCLWWGPCVRLLGGGV
mmetsp:Transcript_22623/g.57557  ORF Transcript_22623/g.57557 Transcript_22623/m.57557 type:complete len:203 (+) Transcript_22623:805-1413(+)